jgi:hypothetical protein
MAWPAWIVTAIAHPEVRRAGIEAATKAGNLLADRLGKRRSASEEDVPVLADPEAAPDAELLMEAMQSLPTKQELAEAIAELDAQNEARIRNLRGLVLILAVAQFLAIAFLIANPI